MQTIESYTEILNALYRIKSGEYNEHAGICGNITDKIPYNITQVWNTWYEKSIYNWPEFAGTLYTPIRIEGYSYFTTDNKWEDSPYGDARRRLLDWMINEFEQLVKGE
jgi:hypothetical protein